MNCMTRLVACLVVLCAAAGFAVADDNAAEFTFNNIDFPGATATFPFGINPQGDIVGNYTAGHVNHGFLLHEGAFTTIDFPRAGATLAGVY
jgi:hypothetical protein